jgi:exodeoxyribonuclease V alpha subunit
MRVKYQTKCSLQAANLRGGGADTSTMLIPTLTQHYAMLQRNLLYTGVTRGKRLVVLVGQKKAVAIAVRNASGRRRWSKLAEWLASKKLSAPKKVEGQI